MRRAILLLGLVSCGFFPEEDLTGRRIGDGVAPWQDLGPLPLCLGTHHVGPPASVVGGFCQPDSAPQPAACVADADCASRERCVCGRCTVQFCTSAAECGDRHVCTFLDRRCDIACDADGDCGARETCVNGACRGGCAVDSDCQAGEVCAGTTRRCIVADCADDTSCQAAEFCDVQRQPREVAEPTVLAGEPGEPPFTMWVEMSAGNPADRAIWRAVSADGLAYRFDPASPVLEAAGDAHAPSVVRDGGGFRLFFETTGGIQATASPDGVTFDPPAQALAGDLHAPAAVVTPDGATLLYAVQGARQAIVLSIDGGAPQPVLTPGAATLPDLWRDVQAVGSPCAVVETSALGARGVHVWFDAFGAETRDVIKFGIREPVPPNDSIGFALAPLSDPGALAAYAYNPVFDRAVLFADHLAERAPAAVRVPGTERWLLYYEGASADGADRQGLGVARNPPEQ